MMRGATWVAPGFRHSLFLGHQKNDAQEKSSNKGSIPPPKKNIFHRNKLKINILHKTYKSNSKKNIYVLCKRKNHLIFAPALAFGPLRSLPGRPVRAYRGSLTYCGDTAFRLGTVPRGAGHELGRRYRF
ncbi:hypothetical protein MNBD_BACTEROID03-2798 [hydrothermal vent metagenome]|uniref:Uncharacterized protein n=1 Tax=hydrothermal vent metagenome TaxID=652676 RepID=A0A3B0TBV0_9ZZZZ